MYVIAACKIERQRAVAEGVWRKYITPAIYMPPTQRKQGKGENEVGIHRER